MRNGKNNIRAKRAIILFFLFILIILLVICIIAYTSKIGIEIENLEIDTEKPSGKKINKDCKIYIFFQILGKIKLFKKNIKHIGIPNVKFQNKDIDIKFLKERDLKIDYKEILKNIEVYFEKIDLYIQIGTEDAALTAILTGIIASFLSIIIRKPRYEIKPRYINKNFLKIKLDCIFSVHLMQYIYKIILKKIQNLGKENLNKKVEV